MMGAIAGDIIGSIHEGTGTKTKHFPLFAADSRFTDDTVLTVAVAEKMTSGGDYVELFHDYYHGYPAAGFGDDFANWAERFRRKPYKSWGNGSAMRVSPVGLALGNIEAVREEARASARVTHSHPEGIRGAEAVASAVFLAWSGDSDQEDIRQYLEQEFGYYLGDSLDDIRDDYEFDISCQGSVPQSIVAFLESEDYEDAIRNAISLGGDADTMAAIAGGIAEAYYGGVPDEIREPCLALLDERLRQVIVEFEAQFGKHYLR
ncbi:MAG: ADP-ribosylglycohydrolase family protein [Pirellulaceae bacterium]|nr:ADP-ribosylglycohydrolase family protein [Pirellulaceae bacterium]